MSKRNEIVDIITERLIFYEVDITMGADEHARVLLTLLEEIGFKYGGEDGNN